MAEVSYVGNRGAYFPAPNMSQLLLVNSVTPSQLLFAVWTQHQQPYRRGAAHHSHQQSSAVQARFPQFKLVPVNGTLTVPSVYQGFPAAQNLIQALRGVPQWGVLTPWLGPPMGKTWYDSMQVKVTKRFSHGLQAAGNFTWAKANVIGSASDSTFFLTGQAVTTDVYNFNDNKQVNQYVRPLALTITFSYTTPKFSATNFGMKVLSQVARDWQLGSRASAIRAVHSLSLPARLTTSSTSWAGLAGTVVAL